MHVRAAFNSPFRPFVLTSTSIGQEGLDFHPWCHRLVHWNLPGNPVDLEQREGRIHRYKGHAVRRNVAASHADDAFASWRAGKGRDIWKLIFDLANQAARDAEESDLVPHWMAPGEHRVERHVPQLPYTAEVKAFDRLKRQLAAYRVVFGQPRQEELVTLLDRAGVDVGRLRDWAVESVAAGDSEASLLTQRARLAFVRRVRLAGLLCCCEPFNGLLQPPVCVLDVLGFRLPP